jgi:hypothetical protein
MKKNIFWAIILGISSLPVSGQSLKEFKKSADEAFRSGDYATALAHSRVVLEEGSDSLAYLQIAGESALELNALDLGESFFREIRRLDVSGEYPHTDFFLAKAHHRRGNYEEAMHFYEQFIVSAEAANLQSPYVALARRKLDECREVSETISRPQPRFEVRPASGINTLYSDFALPLFGDSIYYSSLAPLDSPQKCDCAKPCKEELRLYRLESYGVGSRVLFSDDFENVGHITHGRGGDRMYFTQCKCDDNKFTCAIYYRDRDPNTDTWSKPVKLPQSINQPGYTATQPYLFSEPGGEVEYLYFASDYPGEGAKGGLDIWFSAIRNGQFEAPVNLSQINTDGDETTPFFHGPSETLYFSTNGRTSLGGYDFDIFKAVRLYGGWETPQNLGAPLNSPYDDLYFSIDPRGERAYFSSNREGALYDLNNPDFKHCCPDIFEVEIKSKAVLVSTYCKQPSSRSGVKEPLSEVELTLGNVTDDISGFVGKKINENSYFFENLPLDKTLMVAGMKDRYRKDSLEFVLTESSNDTTYLELFLDPIIRLEVYIRDRSKRDVHVQVNTVYLDDVSEGGASVVLPQNEENTYVYELSGSREYLVYPECGTVEDRKYQFDPPYPQVNISTTCEPGLVRDTFYLFQPDTFLVEPVPLYFYHAVPPRLANPVVAEKDYESYYKEYLARQSEFRTNVVCNADPLEIDTFFQDVDVNMNRMESFAGILLGQLIGGDSIVVTIRGFASASKSGGYSNDDLSKRRIDSMNKYFAKYFERQGYGSEQFAKKIKIISDPVGDGLASNAPTTGPCRIYNIDASRDRRIEIVSIILFPEGYGNPPCGRNPIPKDSF